MDYSLYKKGREQSSSLNNFVQLLKILPISSAACERGFSQMNLHHTNIRNKLHVHRVSDPLMLAINGPPLSVWSPRKYVLTWLKAGRHGALAKATGCAKRSVDVNTSASLFI